MSTFNLDKDFKTQESNIKWPEYLAMKYLAILILSCYDTYRFPAIDTIDARAPV